MSKRQRSQAPTNVVVAAPPAFAIPLNDEVAVQDAVEQLSRRAYKVSSRHEHPFWRAGRRFENGKPSIVFKDELTEAQEQALLASGKDLKIEVVEL